MPLRYCAFISYSHRDQAVARRLHRALEAWRVPRGIDATVGADRRLGRFFRDDDEMAASAGLGAALKGALDDSSALIVVCSPAAAVSAWVDAEVRHFRAGGRGPVLAVIVDGEPNAVDPGRECFPPALRGRAHGDGADAGIAGADEPRAADLRRDGWPRTIVQIAAGLLGLPFDDLWRRDRRRARQRQAVAAVAGVATLTLLGSFGWGWHEARQEGQRQAALLALADARGAAAEGRPLEAVAMLSAHLDSRPGRALVEPSLRVLVGWLPDARAALQAGRWRPVRLRETLALVDPSRNVLDLSDAGLDLRRLLQTRDGRRLVAIGDQRVVVFDAVAGKRLAELDNDERDWIGHAFEAPSGLLLIPGGIFGPTNGAVWPQLLSVSADGHGLAAQEVDAPMLWDSVVGVDRACSTLIVASAEDDGRWRFDVRVLAAAGTSPAHALGRVDLGAHAEQAALRRLAAAGPASTLASLFMGEGDAHPIVSPPCAAPAGDEGGRGFDSAGVPLIDIGSSVEAPGRWQPRAETAALPAPPPFAGCTEAQPCEVVDGRPGERFSRDALPVAVFDRAGWLPTAPGGASSAGPPVYFQHMRFNAGHDLVLCRGEAADARCRVETARGEDQHDVPLLRSLDGRWLFWPFGGVVLDLLTLRRTTPSRSLPRPVGEHHDFEFDRPGLTMAVAGRLVTWRPAAPDGAWQRDPQERASPRYGVLEAGRGDNRLLRLASLGQRHYLAVRSDGTVARLDARAGRERWRFAAAGLGRVEAVHLDPGRHRVLLQGRIAWRLFGLDDGFPLSGLLQPPWQGPDARLAGEPPEPAATQCEPDEPPVEDDGRLNARCGAQRWVWRPPAPEDGEIEAAAQRLACAAHPAGEAIDTIRRCFVD